MLFWICRLLPWYMNGHMMPCAMICWIWREINLFMRYSTISIFPSELLCSLSCYERISTVFLRFLARLVVHLSEKRFSWRIMILYGLNFVMHILQMYVLLSLFGVCSVGFIVYYLGFMSSIYQLVTWYWWLCRLVNDCMRRWPTSFQRTKLHKSNMVRGQS